ncbi:MAG: Exodeoxyribonuclease VII large subunit [uncultured Chloroflexia bacterium]|uniref:Exodeoxyribonuclease 7 large subunit n=1 Tax=uncultured Chloroflexia bacterium TaxID=1672391 RepID=A0A6J4H6V0_9CHLR|nr:MAG: Exodeoxyribonuclease VII large subunit [uncultured Chloroflexia bacterium]
MQILTVADLTSYIRELVDSDAVMADVWVQGEVSNWSRAASGHCYWTLKEGECQIRSVCFRHHAARQMELPTNGQSVLAHGHVSFWEGSGQIQLYVDLVRPAGIGLLHAQIEALKQRLAMEGLFDEGRKRPIPPSPRRIGIVTSPTGAALQDMLVVLARRWPMCEVIVAPSLVQGDGAPDSLVEALFNLYDLELDLILVARGGGSIEDLWAFNDESVARAVFASPVPVITGVGHETDTTVVDFVADLRAPTPSAAAELATPDIAEWQAALVELRERLAEAIVDRLEGERASLEDREARLLRLSPRARLADGQLRADDLAARLQRAMRHRLALDARDVGALQGRLATLSPRATLRRGYAIVRRPDGSVVLRAADVDAGDALMLEVRDGVIAAQVQDQD